METLQINKANALTAYNEANDKGKALLSNLFGKEVFAKARFGSYKDIKTFEDALEYLGEDDQFVKEYTTVHILFLPKDIRAYYKLRIIAKALNNGKVMDYNNSSEYKYYPWFNAKGTPSGFSSNDGYGYGYDDSHSDVGSRLCYISSEIAVYAGKQFLEIYNAYIN